MADIAELQQLLREHDKLLHTEDDLARARILRAAEDIARELSDPRLGSILGNESHAWWQAGQIEEYERALRAWIDVSRRTWELHDLAEALWLCAMAPTTSAAEGRRCKTEAAELATVHGFVDIQAKIDRQMAMFRSAGLDPFAG